MDKLRMKEREDALKMKVKHASDLGDWIAEQISSAEYDSEEKGVPLSETKGWKILADAMRNGYLASYREEFSFRDMHDPVLFPEEFNKAA